MTSTAVTVWFLILLGSALAWLSLAAALYRGLRLRHPALYERLGSPTEFGGYPIRIFGITVFEASGNPPMGFRLIAFIYGSEVRQLDDPGLRRICGVMRVLFPTFVVGFLSFVLTLLIQRGASPR